MMKGGSSRPFETSRDNDRGLIKRTPFSAVGMSIAQVSKAAKGVFCTYGAAYLSSDPLLYERQHHGRQQVNQLIPDLV